MAKFCFETMKQNVKAVEGFQIPLPLLHPVSVQKNRCFFLIFMESNNHFLLLLLIRVINFFLETCN